jgi:hypothetical protein
LSDVEIYNIREEDESSQVNVKDGADADLIVKDNSDIILEDQTLRNQE